MIRSSTWFRSLSCLAGVVLGAHAVDNLALGRPAWASTTDFAPVGAEFAVDGDEDTGWRSTRAEPQWLAVDLQAACTIERVELIQDSGAGRPALGTRPPNKTLGIEATASFAVSYQIQASNDGSAWRTIGEVKVGIGGDEAVAVSATTTRFVRVLVTKRSAEPGVGINELRVFGTTDATRPAPLTWRLRKPEIPASESVAPNADGSLPLNGRWTMSDGRASLPGGQPDVFLADVPGTVLSSLVSQGVFPDPIKGLENLRIPEALGHRAWTWEHRFAYPAALRATGRRVWLEFDGISHRAEVTLNERVLGRIEGPFIRGVFDVTELLADTNRLSVRLDPPAHPGLALEKAAGVGITNGGMLGKDSPAMLASVGWDWMPGVRDRGMGIWAPVRLRTTGSVVVGDPQIVTTLPLPDTSSAEVSISVPVRNVTAQPQSVTVTATIAGATVSKTVDLAAQERRVVAFAPTTDPQLHLDHPRLWWPNGYGEQALYDLTCSAFVGGQLSDHKLQAVGIRTFTYAPSRPIHDGLFEFSEVTARHVRVWCQDRVGRQGFAIRSLNVRHHALKNFTDDKLIDVALGGKASASTSANGFPASNAIDDDGGTRWVSDWNQPEWLAVDLGAAKRFDQVRLDWDSACVKRYSIQVSDDGTAWRTIAADDGADRELVISCNGRRIFCTGGNWGYDEILRRLTPERLDASVRLHRDAGFTMIRNWIGMITREDFYAACDRYGILIWNDFWLANPCDGPDPDDEATFMANAADTVARYRNHPSIALWCGRNEGMPPPGLETGLRRLTTELDGTRYYQPHSADRGVSGNGPYGYNPIARYAALARGFKTEIGMTVVPSADSMRTMLGDEPAWPIGAAWIYHDFSPNGAMKADVYREAIESRYGVAKDLDDFCRKAQLINYDNMRAIFEAWNAKMWDTASGVMLWMSHPAWPSTVWQLYAYDLEPTGAFWGAQKACETVHVQLSPGSDTIAVVNRGAVPLNGVTVTAVAMDLAGAERWRLSAAIDVARDAVVQVMHAPRVEEMPPVHLLRLELRDRAGRVLSDNTYWRAQQDSDLAMITAMPSVKPELSTTIQRTGNRATMTVTITNPATTPMVMTMLTLRDAATNERILPAFWSSNHFALLPGERRVVTVEYAADARTPMVGVEEK